MCGLPGVFGSKLLHGLGHLLLGLLHGLRVSLQRLGGLGILGEFVIERPQVVVGGSLLLGLGAGVGGSLGGSLILGRSKGVAEALQVVPMAAGEVGHGHGRAVVVHGERAEFSQTAPLSQVVDVHVEGQTILQAVNHAGVHDEVHTAVAAYFLGHLAVLLQDGVLVLGLEGFLLSLGHEAVRAEVVHLGRMAGGLELGGIDSIAFYGILVGKALGTGQLIETVVGLGIHHVVLDFDDLAVLRADERRGVVAVAEVVAGLARSFST